MVALTCPLSFTLFFKKINFNSGKKTGYRVIFCKTITNTAWLRMQLFHLFDYPKQGNPSKIIRQRFSDEDIEILMIAKWWNWSFEKISL